MDAQALQSQPLSPEVFNKPLHRFPDEVIEAFNQLIFQKMRNGKAVLRQNDVVDLIERLSLARETNISAAQIYGNSWLDVEDLYSEQGWIVAYDSLTRQPPSDRYEGTFTFSRR